MSLMNLTNDELISNTKKLACEERKIQSEFLWHLLEIQNRKLYLNLGFSSLFDFVVKHLGYSESSAYRRIQAMRLIRDVPSVAQKIENGTLNISAAAQVQKFIKAEKSQGSDVSYKKKMQVVESVENKSLRDVEKHLVSLRPENVLRQEKVRVVTQDIIELRLMIPDSLKLKLDVLKLHFSHAIPDMTYLGLIEHLSEKALAAISRRRERSTNAVIIFAKDDRNARSDLKNERRKDEESLLATRDNGPHRSSPPKFLSEKDNFRAKDNRAPRHIPSVLRHAVWMRDQGCCSFVNPQSGRRCGGKYQLQMDHIIPWSHGGQNTIENLRLLCGEHNRQKGSKTLPENRNNVT